MRHEGTQLAKRLAGKYWTVDGRIYREALYHGCVFLVPFRKIEQ